MRKKLTAVEWLMEEYINGLSINLQIMKKALEMEKEQIMDAWDNGWHEHMNPPSTYITSVKYYNETFKSE